MKNKNLLASVALFSELYNSDKYSNISSLIGEFIKGALAIEKKYACTSYEIVRILERVYDFSIIEGVIRNVLATSLKNCVVVKKNIYYFNETQIKEYEHIEQEVLEKSKIESLIFSALTDFVGEKEQRKLNDSDKTILFESLLHFLYDNGSVDKYSDHIGTFIVKNDANSQIIDGLNLIREGIILYQGIRFTSDADDSGKWNTELVIYLNTEYLFNALSYNGILFKEIFDDFYKPLNPQKSYEQKRLKYCV